MRTGDNDDKNGMVSNIVGKGVDLSGHFAAAIRLSIDAHHVQNRRMGEQTLSHSENHSL